MFENMKETKFWCGAAAGAWLSVVLLHSINGEASLVLPALVTMVAFWKLGGEE